MNEAMVDLDALLHYRAAQPEDGMVYLEGAWIRRTPSVPTDGGAQMVCTFAEAAWRRNLALQHAARTAHRHLVQAEIALRNLTERGLNKDVAVALAAVQRSRELLVRPAASDEPATYTTRGQIRHALIRELVALDGENRPFLRAIVAQALYRVNRGKAVV